MSQFRLIRVAVFIVSLVISLRTIEVERHSWLDDGQNPFCQPFHSSTTISKRTTTVFMKRKTAKPGPKNMLKSAASSPVVGNSLRLERSAKRRLPRRSEAKAAHTTVTLQASTRQANLRLL